MLEIKNLHVDVEGKPILQGVNLNIKPGQVHAIMGPNGSGKSTLAHVIAGKEGYEIKEGQIFFNDKDITELSPNERAVLGLFMSFQYPVEIPGVSTTQFIKTAVNSVRKAQGKEEYDAMNFMKRLRANMKELEMDEKLMKRGVNSGFSGGEKKRNEMLQMMMLEPSLCLLDETDSGLDIDALRVVAAAANQMKSSDRSFVLITHYQRLLNHIEPDVVHVLADGKIVTSGDKSLAEKLEDKGYAWARASA